jgi:branched-subunit amino acid transport protein
MIDLHLWIAILALAGVTVLTRGVFLLPRREPRLPGWLASGLRHAPLAALMAVVVPEVMRGTSNTAIGAGWHDPRWLAVAVSVAWFCWRRGVTGPVVVGTAALLLLRSLGMAG